VGEAALVPNDDGGVKPEGNGWFVLNAKDARWTVSPELGWYCAWEGDGDARFEQLGMNLNVMEPGQPMTMYHGENAQEDFVVIYGECIAIVEGQERPLRQWDLLHCPPGVQHAIVGAGEGPSLVLAVGARGPEMDDHELVYPADPVARAHGAAAEETTSDPREAYKGFSFEKKAYEEGRLR